MIYFITLVSILIIASVIALILDYKESKKVNEMYDEYLKNKKD